MEELLSIVVLVLWIVLSIYNKNRKKKQESVAKKPAQHEEGQETVIRKPRSILEQILLGEEPGIFPYDESTEPQFDENHKTINTYQGKQVITSGVTQSAEYDFNPVKEGGSGGLTSLSNIETPENDYKEQVTAFDLRQAVIYSEILKRPYVN